MEYALDNGFQAQWLEKQKSNKHQDKKMAEAYALRSSQKTSVGEVSGGKRPPSPEEDHESDANPSAEVRRCNKRPRTSAASSRLLALPAPPANPDATEVGRQSKEEILAKLRMLQEQLRQSSFQESTGRGRSLPSPPRTHVPNNPVVVPPPPPPPPTQVVPAEVAAPAEVTAPAVLAEVEAPGEQASSDASATTLVLCGGGPFSR